MLGTLKMKWLLSNIAGAKEMKSCAHYQTIFNPDKADTDNGLKKPLEKATGVTDFLDKSLILGATPTYFGW